MAVIQTQAKQRKDSIEQFQKGGRDDLVRREEAELAILETYLPQTLTSDELDAAITAAIEETGAATVKDLGRVMKALMGRFGTRVDGKAAGERVRALLSGGH
jgi:hypothetical protein